MVALLMWGQAVKSVTQMIKSVSLLSLSLLLLRAIQTVFFISVFFFTDGNSERSEKYEAYVRFFQMLFSNDIEVVGSHQ